MLSKYYFKYCFFFFILAISSYSIYSQEKDNFLETPQSQLPVQSNNTSDTLDALKKNIAQKEALLRKLRVKLNNHRKISVVAIIFLLLIIAFLLWIFHNNRINKLKNKVLQYHNQQIEKQNDMILEQAEELIRTNLELEKLSIVAEQTTNAIIIIKKDGKIEWVNDGFSRLTGFTLNEFVKKFGNNFLNVSSHKDAELIFNTCIQQKEPFSYSTAFTKKNGDKIWLHTNLTPILNDKREVEKLVAINTNITPLKLAEHEIIQKNIEIEEKASTLQKQAEELQETNVELTKEKQRAEEALSKLKNTQAQLVSAEKMISLGQLTAGIAHEINNPINYINSSIDGLDYIVFDLKQMILEYEKILTELNSNKANSLKEKYDYSELINGFEELTSNIKMGVNRTKEIIHSLHMFSRIEDSMFIESDLTEILKSAIVLTSVKNKDHIKITTSYADLPKIECQPGKLSQVFVNIIVNALQAIESHGSITISTMLQLYNDTEFACISISDTGKGIPTEIRSKIYEPFFTTKEVGNGTGLGLSITYGIIKKHNGYIDLKSKTNKGTTFKIYLPLKQSSGHYIKKSVTDYKEG